MDRYRLKNIIILILVLMNFFLLSSLALRESRKNSADRTAAQQLSALFAADGITLDPAVISSETPPTGRTLVRDAALERQVAGVLLGNQLSRSDQGGGISTYSSDRGAALFRASGGFDANGTLSTDAAAFCRSFCKEFQFEEPVFQLDGDGNGTAHAARLYDDDPVFNCTLTFKISGGTLTAVSGTLLPDAFTEVTSEVELLSASAALTAFLKMRRETSAVVSSVTDLYPCFELQSSASVPMALVPSWCIVTNTVNYYVNCVTGAVTFL
ncbi:hypothetical protein [Oscillibacter sp.]|uniref:hypothetical protein n=1 Tax=Oscillibacter sp. TaxID=1945593 RepID=UPI00261C2333|nr:hypothetical protein [Oscillibacter sp.]MDD3346939.1 hypothetical protein [Oscillibacter sp.]